MSMFHCLTAAATPILPINITVTISKPECPKTILGEGATFLAFQRGARTQKITKNLKEISKPCKKPQTSFEIQGRRCPIRPPVL